MKAKLLLIIVLTCVGFAQHVEAKPNRTNTQILSFILDFQERRIIEVAEAMPANKYEFVPTMGAFEGVRTFAEQLKHIAADNYLLGAGILGDNPLGNTLDDERGSASAKTKPQIIVYLKSSFAYMHRAVATIDDAKNPIPTPRISPWPEGTATRLGVAIEDCVHTWDHYGQLVEYLRMNSIVPPASREAANPPAETGTTISQALDWWISNTEREVVLAANAMPEEKYSFAPSGAGFIGVRTFGEQVKHLAANNYRMASRILGHTVPPDQETETGPADVRSKAQIVEYVKGSFTALHQAAASVTEENAVAEVFSGRVGTGQQNTRLQFAVDAVAHSYDHYGQIVEYLRMNGIVPPASRK